MEATRSGKILPWAAGITLSDTPLSKVPNTENELIGIKGEDGQYTLYFNYRFTRIVNGPFADLSVHTMGKDVLGCSAYERY